MVRVFNTIDRLIPINELEKKNVNNYKSKTQVLLVKYDNIATLDSKLLTSKDCFLVDSLDCLAYSFGHFPYSLSLLATLGCLIDFYSHLKLTSI